MRKTLLPLLLVAGFAARILTTPVHAALDIEVTSGVRDPIPIAVVPFAHAAGDGGLDVAEVIQHDLEGSGRFKALPRERLPATPTQVPEVAAAAWKATGSDYVVIGRVVSLEGGTLGAEFDLINTLTGARLAGQRFVGPPGALRNAAHRVSDAVYLKILGVRGAFATRVAYVAVDGTPPAQHYQLFVSDADGANQHQILESRFPLMSPSWSPDGQWLAYVSFETKHAAVYVQLLRTGERRQVSARTGINGSPEWSPDGHKLALTLGGSGGNPDIYILDLATQELVRITEDPAIDTEPVWSPDGRSLYFTSDRAGSPQIYQVAAQPGAHPKRITFGSNYNARPRISPDGTQLALVTLDNGNYRIAVQDLASGTVRVLSHGRLDESPSFAPNGATLIYAEREGSRGALATISTDGLTGLRLSAPQGEVREPAWGPFSP
ncbi:MAG: Tol-Pal system beta propeller repeat protein TolB [Gammaproteobacteria bacterium]|nr:Tol-Pal system beta propeller repeat protein TolB [Gammaproteobacteria bacterium]MBV9622191.1 Tol-Pal system beta propeller repeat protein TolB [Gammaproteobacteria bacterium]